MANAASTKKAPAASITATRPPTPTVEDIRRVQARVGGPGWQVTVGTDEVRKRDHAAEAELADLVEGQLLDTARDTLQGDKQVARVAEANRRLAELREKLGEARGLHAGAVGRLDAAQASPLSDARDQNKRLAHLVGQVEKACAEVARLKAEAQAVEVEVLEFADAARGRARNAVDRATGERFADLAERERAARAEIEQALAGPLAALAAVEVERRHLRLAADRVVGQLLGTTAIRE